jgi:hypothetical protein
MAPWHVWTWLRRQNPRSYDRNCNLVARVLSFRTLINADLSGNGWSGDACDLYLGDAVSNIVQNTDCPYWGCCRMIALSSTRQILPSKSSPIHDHHLILLWYFDMLGARGGAFVWGTGLEAGSSRVRFRPHYGPGVDSASNRKEYQEYFLEVKAAGA